MKSYLKTHSSLWIAGGCFTTASSVTSDKFCTSDSFCNIFSLLVQNGGYRLRGEIITSEQWQTSSRACRASYDHSCALLHLRQGNRAPVGGEVGSNSSQDVLKGTNLESKSRQREPQRAWRAAARELVVTLVPAKFAPRNPEHVRLPLQTYLDLLQAEYSEGCVRS